MNFGERKDACKGPMVKEAEVSHSAYRMNNRQCQPHGKMNGDRSSIIGVKIPYKTVVKDLSPRRRGAFSLEHQIIRTNRNHQLHYLEYYSSLEKLFETTFQHI